MTISGLNLIYIYFIFLIGVVTTFTDLRTKKIHNLHLTIFTTLAAILIIYMSIIKNENLLTHLTDGWLASLIGWLLYRFNLWRGGDAKLFALYALLMPPIENNNVLFSNAMNLFFCSFIFGATLLLPFLIGDTVLNFKSIAVNLFAPKNINKSLRTLEITILSSWVLFPLIYFINRNNNAFIAIIITYIIFVFASRVPRTLQRNLFIMSGMFIIAFLLRIWLIPSSLTWQAIAHSIFNILIYSSLSACFYTILQHFKKRHERIPFAPLLFIGCILSYTPFLNTVAHILHK